ncbi:nitroreductase family deazaflavin-dependent oxidoreductase [Protofrankia symbiont of Coriaria ruscifolia]|uniref:nitroreductase family deazaflavin-dependent oxidoreductase n=1 Tax=Protofrankia symbiont of Coriaria ruscifolia TaxID=1306542 RepID=UPI001040E7CC|nr:nitroreductase family deazaflavin-dependent oxidoreductase [Protofrankia symbiont of Coriaria ruscifolia]
MTTKIDPRSPDFDRKGFNRALITEYRANNGTLTTTLPEAALLLLTTVGTRSGRPHTTPLGYILDGSPDRIVVFASNLASAAHPDWYRNLVANPRVTVELGADRFDAAASTTAGPERERLYQALIDEIPSIRDHQGQTSREIPVVLLRAVR